MTTFPPNPAVSLKLMEIGFDLEHVSDSTIFGHSIHHAVKCGNVKGIVKEIYEQSKDNRDSVSDIVGEKALRKIESLCNTSWDYLLA